MITIYLLIAIIFSIKIFKIIEKQYKKGDKNNPTIMEFQYSLDELFDSAGNIKTITIIFIITLIISLFWPLIFITDIIKKLI